MLKRLAVVFVAIATMLATLLVAAAPVHAANGEVKVTKSIPNLTFYVGGVARSELRNGTVTFWKNTIDGGYWAVVKAEIRDRSSDGYCAKAAYSMGYASAWGYECNAEWKPFNATLDESGYDRAQTVVINLGRGSTTGTVFAGGLSTGAPIYAPAGW